jgi:hypothetical protein
MGLDFVNLGVPLRREIASKHSKDIKRKFYRYDWTRAAKK